MYRIIEHLREIDGHQLRIATKNGSVFEGYFWGMESMLDNDRDCDQLELYDGHSTYYYAIPEKDIASVEIVGDSIYGLILPW